MIVVQKGCVFELRELGLQHVDKALYLEIGVFVQWKEVDSVEHIQDVTVPELHCLQVLRKRKKMVGYFLHRTARNADFFFSRGNVSFCSFTLE